MITRRKIVQYVKNLGREFNPERVVLFGSYARGEADENSDVDLLVVMEHGKPRNVDQSITMQLRANPPFPLDMLVRRPQEVSERLAMGDSFLKGIMSEGKILYDRSR
jgi:predicted nucleotidyltransferase